MNELIRTLTQAWGPTSYEEGIRASSRANSIHSTSTTEWTRWAT